MDVVYLKYQKRNNMIATLEVRTSNEGTDMWIDNGVEKIRMVLTDYQYEVVNMIINNKNYRDGKDRESNGKQRGGYTD